MSFTPPFSTRHGWRPPTATTSAGFTPCGAILARNIGHGLLDRAGNIIQGSSRRQDPTCLMGRLVEAGSRMPVEGALKASREVGGELLELHGSSLGLQVQRTPGRRSHRTAG